MSAAEEIWRAQSVWSQAANRYKVAIARARLAVLSAGIAAGVLGTASAQLMAPSPQAGRAFAFLALLAAGSAPLVGRGAAPDRVRDWIRLRSVSEELKSQAYVYLAGLGRYRRLAERDAELRSQTDMVLAEAADLEPTIHGIRPAVRPLPAVTDSASYVTGRLRHQLERYYRPKAHEMASRARLVERWGQTLAAVAVVLGGLAGALQLGQAAAWIPVVAAVSAAVLSHGASARYVAQQIEFSTAAGELERLLHWWQRCDHPTEEDADLLVERTEHVVSVQNEGWMAKWIAD
ncbi:DUF4231 domain-containing protein [Streptomyces hokutonensis]|uniref:DUF4231 domain-containing protein n=1 Tax=Streptomyces hokutonensis TaxID=1306990 RepID=UPI0004755E28|nr:DUF4231 domain-containing protein [Streptomyces hokutonensis]